MQDNVWQEIAILTLYRRPFSADPLFGFNSIDLVAFGCVSSGLPKDVISHATTSDPPGVVKARSCFSIFSSSKKCCPKLKKGRRWRTSPPPVLEKKGGGQQGLKRQNLRRTRFPRQTVSLLKCPKTGVLLRILVLGMIGLDEVLKQLFFFFRRVGCSFFLGVSMPFPCHQMQS